MFSKGTFYLEQRLDAVTILGLERKPVKVEVQGRLAQNIEYLSGQGKLLISGMDEDLNGDITVQWA